MDTGRESTTQILSHHSDFEHPVFLRHLSATDNLSRGNETMQTPGFCPEITDPPTPTKLTSKPSVKFQEYKK